MDRAVTEDDLNLLDAIEKGTIDFDRAAHEPAIRRIALSTLGEDVPVPSRSVALQIRSVLERSQSSDGSLPDRDRGRSLP